MGKYTDLVEKTLNEGLIRKLKAFFGADKFEDYMKELKSLEKDGWVLSEKDSVIDTYGKGSPSMLLYNKKYSANRFKVFVSVGFVRDKLTSIAIQYDDRGSRDEFSHVMTNKLDIKWIRDEATKAMKYLENENS